MLQRLCSDEKLGQSASLVFTSGAENAPGFCLGFLLNGYEGKRGWRTLEDSLEREQYVPRKVEADFRRPLIRGHSDGPLVLVGVNANRQK